MVFTNKDFIGKIERNSFLIIDSSYPLPYGATCVLKGIIGPESQIIVTTTLHKIFRIFSTALMVILMAVFVISCIRNAVGIYGLLVFAIVISIGTLLFRLYLHLMYVAARNKALKRLKMILEIVDAMIP